MLRRIAVISILVCYLAGTAGTTPDPSDVKSPYRRIVQDGITVFCADEDLIFGKEILSLIRSEIPRMGPRLGLRTSPDVYVLIAESEHTFNRVTASAIPDWGIGAADAGSGFIFLKSPRFAGSNDHMYAVAKHELVHVLVGSVTSGYETPRWFDEGLAQVLSDERSMRFSLRLARSVQAQDVIRLNEIDEVLTFQKQRAALAYGTAHAAVDFLIRTYGESAVPAILQRLGAGQSMSEAMRASIRLTQGDFESAWLDEMRSRYRWAFVINFPFLMSAAFVLLFIAAYWMTRRRMTEKRRLWESEPFRDEETATPD